MSKRLLENTCVGSLRKAWAARNGKGLARWAHAHSFTRQSPPACVLSLLKNSILLGDAKAVEVGMTALELMADKPWFPGGLTALGLAAAQGGAAVVASLLRFCPPGYTEAPALCAAIERDADSIVRLLVQHASPPPRVGACVLAAAAEQGSHRLLALLLPHADPTDALVILVHNHQWEGVERLAPFVDSDWYRAVLAYAPSGELPGLRAHCHAFSVAGSLSVSLPSVLSGRGGEERVLRL